MAISKGLVDVVHICLTGGVILQVCEGNLVVITLEVSNHLEATYVSVGNVLGLECTRVDVAYVCKYLDLKGLVDVTVNPE